MPFIASWEPPSDAMLKAIGQSIIDWNELERAMESVIWSAYEMPHWTPLHMGKEPDPVKPYGHLITHGMGFRIKRDNIKSIVSASLPKIKQDKLKPLFTLLKDLEGDRNIIVHGEWYESKAGNAFVNVFRSKIRNFETYSPTLEGMEDFCLRTKETTDQLNLLADSLRFQLP